MSRGKEELRARLGLDSKPFEDALGGLGAKARAGFAKIGDFAGAQRAALFGLARSLVAPLAGIATIEGIAGKVSDAIERARDLQRAQRATGIGSVETLQGFQFAAEKEGVSAEQLQKALAKLRLASVAALDPLSEQGKAMKKLGIESASFASLRPEDQLRRFADAVANSKSESAALASVTKIVGEEGAQLFALFRQGSAGLNAFAKDTRVLKESTVTALAEMRVSVGKFTDGLVGSLLNKAVPVLKKLTDGLKGAKLGLEELAKPGAGVGGALGSGIASGLKALAKSMLPGAGGPPRVTNEGSVKEDQRTKFTLGELASLNIQESKRARQVIELENKARLLAAKGKEQEAEALFKKADILKVGDKEELARIKRLQNIAASENARADRLIADGKEGTESSEARTRAANAENEAKRRQAQLIKDQGGFTSEQLRAQAARLRAQNPTLQGFSDSEASRLESRAAELEKGLQSLNESERKNVLEKANEIAESQLKALLDILEEQKNGSGPVVP